MRLLVLTSCTGRKAVRHGRALTARDFQKGLAHVARRERELADLLTPARDLYAGQQHLRLLRGVRVWDSARPAEPASLFILSACRPDEAVAFGGPTLLFCAESRAGRLPRLPNLRVVPVGSAAARRFSCP